MVPKTPRFQGLDRDHIAWLLTGIDQRLAEYGLDGFEPDYRGAAHCLGRSQLRFAAGFTADEVVDDLWGAARCLVGRENLHFLKTPPERFRTRRIEPVEVAACCGDPFLARQLLDGYGFSLATLVADLADAALKEEVRVVTRFFDGRLRDALDLAGLGATVWAAGLAALLTGYEDEVVLGVRLFRETCRTHPGLGDGDANVNRFRVLVDLLAGLLRDDGAAVAAGVTTLVEGHEGRLRAGMKPEEWARPPAPPRYYDLSAVAVLAVAALRRVPVEPARLGGEAAAYADFLAVFTSPKERKAPLPPMQGEVVQAPEGNGAAAPRDRQGGGDATGDDVSTG